MMNTLKPSFILTTFLGHLLIFIIFSFSGNSKFFFVFVLLVQQIN